MIVKNVAVVGASGAVGDRMIRLLEERSFPVAAIKFLASERSAGKTVTFRGETLPIEELVAGRIPRRRYRPVEHSGQRIPAMEPDRRGRRCGRGRQFERLPDGPGRAAGRSRGQPARHRLEPGIIANPNCSTIQMVVALKPLHDPARVRRVVVSTYQSVSGAGLKGIHELETQTEAAVRKERPLRPRSLLTRSSATASRRSTTSCPAATPRKS